MTVNLHELVKKRYAGNAWIVLYEVGNGTGSNVNRHADAVAIGIWPSHGYEINGMEFKRSRSDVRKELDDPSKADAVGKYCDYWWLVVEDLKIIDGLVIPATWGILYPRAGVLRVHRKAPKRQATPISRAFCAAVIRRVTDEWVPRHKHDALKATALEQAKVELERTREIRASNAEHDLKRLQQNIASFEEASGVKLDVSSWRLGDVGRAVKAVLDARDQLGRHAIMEDPERMIRGEASAAEHRAEMHEEAAKRSRQAAKAMLDLIGKQEQLELPHQLPD